ncbi:MAG: serine/threonine-protein kinase [Polyangiales bacterium]
MPRGLTTQLRRAPTRYRPIKRLAVGGMAEVWTAEAILEDGTRHEVAIKRVLPEMGAPMYRAMFEDEARLGMLLRHPNIVRVYDARDVGGTYIMVMELVDGDSLKGFLDPAHERGAFMPLAAALYIGRELARALEYCHTAKDASGESMNIIHRDVSPHNLLLGRDGSVKLTDFGLAEANVVTDREMMGGKLGYLAPEIVSRGEMGPGTDVFALGIVLWEMLAGRPLFLGDNDKATVQNVARCEIPSLHDFNPGVPASVDMLLSRVLVADPAQRLSASIIAGALDRALEGTSVGPKDVSLMVGMHLAKKRRVEKTDIMASIGLAMLEQELQEFAAQAGGDAPLDPNEFASESESEVGNSGLRVRPLHELDD